MSQNSSISGIVIDSTNSDPLIGVNVILKGSSLGAATDKEGKYSIKNIPGREYVLEISYIGYMTESIKVNLENNRHLIQDFRMRSVSLEGETIEVTAQASGQQFAINQQIASDNIVNVVSAARIQELPDANAAESLSRLPGIYLLRSGGEGYAIAIRGLQPKYNLVMMDGVPMPPTSASNRTVNMSMISSSMLSGIEVFKTVTPDMDAAVMGGTVNFQMREAQKSDTDPLKVDLLAQGEYNNLQNDYGNYKFAASIGNRFFNDQLGILLQGVAENVNRTSAEINADYDLLTTNFGEKNPQELVRLSPTYKPRRTERYDATLIMDYKLPDGKVKLMNFFSSGKQKTETRGQQYNFNFNEIKYNAGYSSTIRNNITNLLDFQYRLLFDVNLKLSHSYTENVAPENWGVDFRQTPDLSVINSRQNPEVIARSAMEILDLEKMYFNNLYTSDSFKKQRDFRAAMDIKHSFNISNSISATFKFGGMYKSSSLFYDYNIGRGTLYAVTATNVRKVVLSALPWMTQPPHNMNPDGIQQFPVTLFTDPDFSYGKFLNGAYTMGMGTDLDLIKQVIDVIKAYQLGRPVQGGPSNPYSPLVYESFASDYSGDEYESAAYIMATLKVGSQITIIPGVRFQSIKTSYTAPQTDKAGVENPYPRSLPHIDTTMARYHGYWLPALIVRYKPFSWLDFRAAYTNTLSYPSPTQITPRIDINIPNNSVIWHNFDLEPARSQNYDAGLSFYTNEIGIFTVNGFLKQIDKMIFGSGRVYISDPSDYPGLPSYTQGYSLNTSINNSFQVDVWGIELDWQTHFWYLPDPFFGLVLNVNYTHIFSGAKYPYVVTYPGSYPDFKPTYVDTFYTDRLIYQPKDIVNLSIGYDYKGFSMAASMIYQGDVFQQTAFWPESRSDKAKYLRWDLILKQELPWFGLSTYLNLNNLNSESDVFINNGNGFPLNQQTYGLTATLGLRWQLE